VGHGVEAEPPGQGRRRACPQLWQPLGAPSSAIRRPSPHRPSPGGTSASPRRHPACRAMRLPKQAPGWLHRRLCADPRRHRHTSWRSFSPFGSHGIPVDTLAVGPQDVSSATLVSGLNHVPASELAANQVPFLPTGQVRRIHASKHACPIARLQIDVHASGCRPSHPGRSSNNWPPFRYRRRAPVPAFAQDCDNRSTRLTAINKPIRSTTPSGLSAR